MSLGDEDFCGEMSLGDGKFAVMNLDVLESGVWNLEFGMVLRVPPLTKYRSSADPHTYPACE